METDHALLARFTKYPRPGEERLTAEECARLKRLGWVRWSTEDARFVLTDEGQREYLHGGGT